MFSGLCHVSTWENIGNFGMWEWLVLALTVIFWLGLLAGLALLVVWVTQRARVPAGAVAYATGQPTAKETVQLQYARGEISREKYELIKQAIESGQVLDSRKGESK